MKEAKKYTVALAGNPNVGKSTVFNALTGLRQHTGNWPGKTVARETGCFTYDGDRIELVDVPGTYSLAAHSPEEAIAAEYITATSEDSPDAVVAVCDACCLERGLILALDIINTGKPTVLCINLADEAIKRGITVDTERLEELLCVPCVSCAARSGVGLEELKRRTGELLRTPVKSKGATGDTPSASELAKEAVSFSGDPTRRDRFLDRLFTGRLTALPVTALLVAVVFFITLKGAAPISDALSVLLTHAENAVRYILSQAPLPRWAVSLVCDGVLRVLFWVTSVMLPPMAIFFPLFTFIEDLGYLPRVAYNFDCCFRRCGACGKQALTMMMGLGCNAAGVTGCRIIDSPRERLIAVLTNSLMPCNGRFPVLAVFIAVFACAAGISGMSAFSGVALCLLLALGAALTLAVSAVLSTTVLRGKSSAFTLELPPYRLPKVKDIIVRSLIDRTLAVLGRAVTVAAPAGLVIWILGNVSLGGGSLLSYVTRFLDPIGRMAGMDGVILCAFILALPAAEITLPLILMGYAAGGTPVPLGSLEETAGLLLSMGWNGVTAACAAVFTLIHWPCSTTIITIYKETGSLRQTAAAVAIPSVTGYALCVLINLVFS